MVGATTVVKSGEVTFAYRGFTDVSAFLHGTKMRARDLRPIWPAVGDVIASGMNQQFLSGGGAGGSPWAPLNPQYRQWKIAHGYDPRTLIRTKRLWKSLISRPMAVERHYKARADFGTDVPYYKFHHLGTKFMPQRRVMRTFPPQPQRIARKVEQWIVNGVTG